MKIQFFKIQKFVYLAATIPLLLSMNQAGAGQILVRGKACERNVFTRSPMRPHSLCYDEKYFYVCAGENDPGMQVLPEFFRINTTLKIDAIPTPENIRLLEQLCTEDYEIANDGYKPIPWQKETEFIPSADNCPRLSQLPKVLITGETHTHNLVYGDSRKALFDLAAAGKILFGSESGYGGDSIQQWEYINKLRYEPKELSPNFFPVDSTAEWIVVASYKVQKELLPLEDVLTGRVQDHQAFRDLPETLSSHLVSLFSNPFSLELLRRAFSREASDSLIPGGRELRLKLLSALNNFRPMRFDFIANVETYTVLHRILEPLSLAERKSLLIEIHKLVVSGYMNQFASKLSRMGIDGLPIYNRAEQVQKFAWINGDNFPRAHGEQLAHPENGEFLMAALRSESFASEVARKACNASSKFSEVYVNVGANHLNGVENRLRQLLGRHGLQVQTFELKVSRQAAEFLKILDRLK